MSALREGMPQLPPRMRGLPTDPRGYPVPWFVKWYEGKPDFRIIDTPKLYKAHNHRLCWICGNPRYAQLAFVAGPMCVLNRTSGEPPCHYDCAQFAAHACPFLMLPTAQRRDAKLPTAVRGAPGHHLDRNPGVTVIYLTRSYKAFDPGPPKPGVLFEMGEPQGVEWYCQGEPATRAQVEESIETGLPHLRELAKHDDDGGAYLQHIIARAQPWLPPA